MANNPTDFQKAKKDARNYAEQAKSDVKGAFTDAAENFKEDFKNSNLRKEFQNKLEGAEETAREYGEQLRSKANEVVNYIENETRANPLKVAAIAFVTGVVTAAILGRRN